MANINVVEKDPKIALILCSLWKSLLFLGTMKQSTESFGKKYSQKGETSPNVFTSDITLVGEVRRCVGVEVVSSVLLLLFL